MNVVWTVHQVSPDLKVHVVKSVFVVSLVLVVMPVHPVNPVIPVFLVKMVARVKPVSFLSCGRSKKKCLINRKPLPDIISDMIF